MRGAPGDAGPRRRADGADAPGARAALDGFWGDIRDRAWAVGPPRSSATVRDAARRAEKALRETERWISADSVTPPPERRTDGLETRRVRVPHRGPERESAPPWKIGKLVLVAPAPPGGPRAFGSTRRVARLEAGRVQRRRGARARSPRKTPRRVWRRETTRAAPSPPRARSPAPSARTASASAHPGNFSRLFPSLRTSRFCPGARPGTRGVSSASFQRGRCVVDPKPSRVQNRRAQVRERARVSGRVARRRRGAPARTDGDEAYASSAPARAARVSADALALAESKAPRRARRGCCARPSTPPPPRRRKRRAAATAKEFLGARPPRASPAGTRGGRSAARCGATPPQAPDTAAELLADAASRVPVDGTESAEPRRVAALASTRAAAARRPDPRATRRETFPVARLPRPGPGDSRASSTPSGWRLLPPA